ncbi:DNA-binding transcriptional LysR family regulator [Zhihengliuella halotolerans]|uniref:DNA-binding transcriptional LysR family regulator n=2 Tax=Zhihengliuella halotolerans TaxID=370736 RepID=A0A4Q8AG95_9MICC|nr:DNA-binding transcriptional LysR family regulator [Zhihengliuella halotolerans]
MDLNLLRAFMTIYETGSLTRAASVLSVTQPSVSYALGRLRKQLSDPLFIRSADGMTPTRRATELFETIKPAIAVIDATVETGRNFDPASTRHEFRLCLSDLGELTFLPPILRAFGSEAPNATLEIIPMKIDSVSEWLMRGDIDAAVASVPIEGAEHHEILFEDRYVCVLPQSYTSSSESLTLSEFAALPHIAIDRSSGHYQVDRVLESMQIKRRVVLRLHHFSVLPQIVASNDYAAIVPLHVAELFASQQPVNFHELPFQMPAFNVSLYWNGAAPVAPGRTWFREMIADALK